ncbi:MAG: flagellar motor protein MotB [Leptospirales bacterium]|nr:flagellar motor protein MotB [Leptospirales bacterium]
MAKKVKCPPCEEGAPLWLQTYGDMVTLMLCLFVMIFATGKATPQEIQLILSAFNNSMGFFTGGQTLSAGRLEEMGMNLESLPSMTRGRSLSRSKQEAVSVFQPEIRARKVRISEDERGLVISLISADFFRPGSAQLTASAEEVLQKAAVVCKNLERYVRVEGYSSSGEDESLAGQSNQGVRDERNYSNSWDLAGARAINATAFMSSQGVPAQWMQAVSYGAFRPLASEGDAGTPEASAHNRRIDIVILTNKDSVRGASSSGFRLPETPLPGAESLLPD